ncbi:hypothetical protein [Pararhizobium arenae]|uniref:hypothetical protein n=1 Tax=Pararhizobium arenae TaxID=1856850 RepID=UPI00094B1EB1|nr:hypothetical protein [Pararhizobium arenae]
MASSAGQRPPITEGVAEVMVKDIKSNEGKSVTSEVPLAFQTSGRPPVDTAELGDTRKQIVMFLGFAAVVLVVLLGVWWVA